MADLKAAAARLRAAAEGETRDLAALAGQTFQVTIDVKSNRVVVTASEVEQLSAAIEAEFSTELVVVEAGEIERVAAAVGFDPDPTPGVDPPGAGVDPDPGFTATERAPHRTIGISESEVSFLAERYSLPAAEARRQLELQGPAGALSGRVSGLETFAGIWIEHSPFGVYVAFTGDAESQVADFAGDFPSPEELIPVNATYSFQELRAADARLRAGAEGQVPELVALVGEIFQSSIDVKLNRVVVTSPDAERLRPAIEGDLPNDLVVVQTGVVEQPRFD